MQEKKSLEEVRNSFENDFLEIFNLFLIDKEISDYNEKNRILIKEFFNSFPNLNDPKLIDLVNKLRENEINKLIDNIFIKNYHKILKKVIKEQKTSPLKN